MKRKNREPLKPRTKDCERCGAPYLSAEKHAETCPAGEKAQARGMRELCELCGAWYYHLEGHECSDVKAGAGPAVIIPRQHQSAPKEHWAEKEVRLAAQEIVEGKAPADVPADEFFRYGETQTVAHHPRVIEAMAKLEREIEEPRNTQELVEKTAMYHEMNERAAQPNKWDGQGRWMGKDNEGMRKGELLTPQAFMARLLKVIGPGRIELNTFAVLKRVAILAPDPDWKPARVPSKLDMQVEILREMEKHVDSTIDMKKQLAAIDAALAAQKVADTAPIENLRGKKQVATLQYPLGTEWMIMKFDAYGVPVCPKFLGWRTALLTLIKLGIITEKEAHKAFPLGSGPASEWYRHQLFTHRNQGAKAS